MNWNELRKTIILVAKIIAGLIVGFYAIGIIAIIIMAKIFN